MTVKVEVTNISEVKEFLKNKQKKIDQNAEAGVNKATFFMQGEVKESIAGRRNEPTSVDTGRFLNSVDLATEKKTGVVFTDIEYAQFLEYGTSRLIPRKHFRNSVARNENKVKEIIQNEL